MEVSAGEGGGGSCSFVVLHGLQGVPLGNGLFGVGEAASEVLPGGVLVLQILPLSFYCPKNPHCCQGMSRRTLRDKLIQPMASLEPILSTVMESELLLIG